MLIHARFDMPTTRRLHTGRGPHGVCVYTHSVYNVYFYLAPDDG